MSHTEIAELLGAYALDAVADDDERARIEAHLASCPRCRAEVQDHREVATLLAHDGGEAPEGLWDRIAASLEPPAPPLRLASAPRRDERLLRAVPQFVVAGIAAAVVLIAALGIQLTRQDQRIDELQAAGDDPVLVDFQSALEDPDSQVIDLRSADGSTALRGAITEDGVGYLRTTALPELSTERTYQLWGDAGDRLVSLGVLGPDPGVVTFRGDRYQGFAITEEVAPGVVVTANSPVVAGTAA